MNVYIVIIILLCLTCILTYILFYNKRKNTKQQHELFERNAIKSQDMPQHVLLALADARYNGVGNIVPIDLQKAETLYAKVAETSAEGYLRLGRLHRDGNIDQPPDGLKAIENYIKSY